MYNKLLILFFITTAFAAEITDIDVSQRTDGSGIVEINYRLTDVSGTFPSFTISVEISFDNGQTYESVLPDQLSGDVGANVQADDSNLKYIEYQAYGGVYTSAAIIKIKGEGHYVVSDLPFAMVNIESNSAVTTFEGEDINYNYEIMQYELKNSDFVQWLETYSFHSAINYDSDPSWETGDAAFNCLDYQTYYYIPWSGDGDGGGISGCTDTEALNYNPFATDCWEGDCCVYESNLGCDDSNATNYDNDNGWNEIYNDCSCSYLSQIENLGTFGPIDPDNPTNGYWSWSGWENPELTDLGLDEFSYYNIYTCTNSSALNYDDNLISQMNNMGANGITAFTLIDDGSCVYECNETYPWENPTYDEWPYVKVKDFRTLESDGQGIWYQGSSFNIQSDPTPLGQHPVQFNSEECIHSVLLTLYMDYYGLRVPTGGEWMKAARGDDERCWPWMDGSCQAESEAYCSQYYSCLSNEQAQECYSEVESCMETCDDLHTECLNDLEAQTTTCITDCIAETGNEESPSYNQECFDCWESFSNDAWAISQCDEGNNCFCTLCSDPDDPECTDTVQYNIVDTCSDCVDSCIINGENSDFNDSSCNMYASWTDEYTCLTEDLGQDDDDNCWGGDEDGTYDNCGCGGTYANYVTNLVDQQEEFQGGPSAEHCWSEMSNCQELLSNCMGTSNWSECDQDQDEGCGTCTSIYSYELDPYIDGSFNQPEGEEGLVDSSYISYLYYDRFNFIRNHDTNNIWPTMRVNYYDGTEGNGRDGRSVYGIYNMTGNASEIVLKNGQYYVMGTSPENVGEYNVRSFCNDQNWGNDHQAIMLFVDNPSNASPQKYFGVRLARTAPN